jgi:hypothetical protein
MSTRGRKGRKSAKCAAHFSESTGVCHAFLPVISVSHFFINCRRLETEDLLIIYNPAGKICLKRKTVYRRVYGKMDCQPE